MKLLRQINITKSVNKGNIMFIQTESTPNPETLKFMPGVKVSSQSMEFHNAEDAKGKSRLAVELLTTKGVKSVFFGYDFITITKDSAIEWFLIKAPILGIIMEHFITNEAAIDENSNENHIDSENIIFDPKDEKIIQQILELMESRIRPSVASDGGDIQLRAFTDGVVYLQMHGACSGCPSSTATLKVGVENLLKHYIPEVKEVKQAF